MPVITTLKPQKNRKRVNIYLDGKFAFGIDLDNLATLNLRVGTVLAEKEIEEIIKKANLQKVLGKLLRFATLRPRSKKEIDTWLTKYKVLLIAGVIIVGIAGFAIGDSKPPSTTPTKLSQNIENQKSNNQKQASITPLPTPTTTTTPTPTPIPVGIPVKIEIPKMGIVTEIVQVGVTPKNVMEVPTDASMVGWFINGARPGQLGGAILNGHYDTPTGRPAVFYNLERLSEGDEIIITTNKNEHFVFKVKDLLSQPYKTFPKELVYENAIGKELRLITCDGVWNSREGSYSDRLVVYASL